MAYALAPDEDTEAGIRRIGRELLERAVGDLTEPDRLGLSASVHDARKACKQLRGLVRLVRPGLGEATCRRANDTVRDAARELSSLRDAQALVVTFDALIAADGRLLDGPVLATRRALVQRARDADAAVSAADPRITRALELLDDVAGAVDGWSADESDIAGGLTKTYGRARRALAAAQQDPTDEGLHEWRKRVKYSWYHVRLLAPSAPSVLDPLDARFHDLSDVLGDDHDLAVLRRQLVDEPDDHGGAGEVDRLVALIADRRADLLRRAIGLGSRLLVEEPEVYSARLTAYRSIGSRLGSEPSAGEIRSIAPPDDGLDELNVVQLRALAREVELPGRGALRRDDLIASLRAAQGPGRPSSSLRGLIDRG